MQNLSPEVKPTAQFLREFKAIVDELASTGTPIGPAKINVGIFRLLPAEYHPVVVALSTKKHQVSFTDLSGRLIAHEVLLQSTRQSSPVMANMARNTNSTSIASIIGGQPSKFKGSADCVHKYKINKQWFPYPCPICNLNNH